MNRNRARLYQLGSLTVAMSLGVWACSPVNTSALAPTPTATLIVQTTTPSQAVALSTSTLTPHPTASLTPTLKPPTPTAQAVLSAVEAKSLMLDLLQNNGNCVLPCLWGITPGEKAAEALEPFLARFSQGSTTNGDVALRVNDFDKAGGVHLSFVDDKLEVGIALSYYRAGDRVGQLVLSTDATKSAPEQGQVFGDSNFNQLVQYYALPHILSEYGRPTQVLIAPFPADPDYPSPEWIPFSVVLYYPDEGILVEYLSPREIRGDQYIGCPHKAHVYATVWDPQRKPTLSEIVTKLSGRGINELNVDYFKPVEEVTSTDLDGFVEEFKDMQTLTCLETRISLWP